ncbi:hypothetical protein D3C83_93700 [compost metagenome]
MKMPRSISYSIGMPASLQVGMSFHDMVAVTLSLYARRSPPNTHSGRNLPLRQWATASMGLLTLESMCLPTSCVATVPPPLNGT